MTIRYLECAGPDGGHIFDVKNWRTDDTGLTDKLRFFSALQKNLDCFAYRVDTSLM
jgi:hypothetical protein